MEQPIRIPGLGSNELKIHEQAVWRVNARVQEMTEAFRLRMQLLMTPDQPEVIRKLLEVLLQLNAMKDTQNNQDQAPQDKSGPD
jgi:hypothetical protein